MSPEQRAEIEATMRRDEKILVRWLTKRLGDSDSARDVAQNVFLRVWAFAEDSEVENPRALIFKAAANLACNEMKRRNRHDQRHLSASQFRDDDPIYDIPSSGPSPEKQATLNQDVAIVMAAIKDLPERPRRAFEMNRFDGLSYKQIAETMNVSESSVEKYMIEALKRLRASLDEKKNEDGKILRFPAGRGRGKPQ